MTCCEVCGYSFKHYDTTRLHKHHIRPKEHGGSDEEANKIVLCPNCHSIAHILLSLALDSGAIDIYKLYAREHLTVAILRYQRSDLVSQFKIALYNLWNYKWFRVALLRNSKRPNQSKPKSYSFPKSHASKKFGSGNFFT